MIHVVTTEQDIDVLRSIQWGARPKVVDASTTLEYDAWGATHRPYPLTNLDQLVPVEQRGRGPQG